MNPMHKIAMAEKILPVMCQLLAIEGMQHEGYAISTEHQTALTNAMHASLRGLNQGEKAEVITATYSTANAVLRGEHVGSFRQLLLAACMFACKLVDEGMAIDPGSQPVLIGLLILDEAKEDETGEWGFSKKRLEEAAGRMLSRTRLLGLFTNKILAIH